MFEGTVKSRLYHAKEQLKKGPHAGGREEKHGRSYLKERLKKNV